MPVGQYFRGLTAYDLLGNLVPGSLALISIMGFLPEPPLPTTIGGYGLFALVAFVTGSIIQAHASKAVGEAEHFNKTMAGVENLPNLSQKVSEEEPKKRGDKDRDHSERTTWCHPFLGPVIWWRLPVRGKELDDVILVNRIWAYLIDTPEIPFRTTSYSVLYHLMCSKVDNIGAPSLATRIQAIRNFHRGMWITSWYSLLLISISLIISFIDDVIGIRYPGPSYSNYWPYVWQLALISALGVLIFWILFESSEEDYIEYLFADYAIAISDGGNEITFPEEVDINVANTDLESSTQNRDYVDGDESSKQD